MTQHTAFAYLALDYGLQQVSITGLNGEADPSINKLEELSKIVKDYEIKTIYAEENSKRNIADTLAKETNVQVEILSTLESLTKDQEKSGKDYITLMRDNLANLEKSTSQPGKELPKTEKEKNVYNGYFEDSAVKDRDLSDYAGEWKSVYPLLENGDLDQVFDIKSKRELTKSAQQFKEYYEMGYRSDIDNIKIDGNTMEFVSNGESKKFTYKYAGLKILTYSKGNRGVRFLFETDDPSAGKYKYVQFSDHNISPIKTNHFHIYIGGESHEKLFSELENWPTYYPENLTSFEIAQEMASH